MAKLLVKYMKGWINADYMKEPGWIQSWINVAEEAAAEDCELVVFKVPKKPAGTVTAIEQMLQDRLGE